MPLSQALRPASCCQGSVGGWSTSHQVINEVTFIHEHFSKAIFHPVESYHHRELFAIDQGVCFWRIILSSNQSRVVLVQVYPLGKMSSVVQDWAVGSRWPLLLFNSFVRISARGPFGEPPVSLNKETRVVMFCQGTGIVPFMPMLQDLLEEETETIVSFISPPTMSFLRRLYRSPWFTAVQVLKSCFSCQILMSFAATGISISEFSSPLGKFWLAGGPLLFTDVYKSSNFESKCLGTTLKSAW